MGQPDFLTVINRGWGLTTLNIHPNKHSDIMGGVEGVKEYAFELKWSKYVQKYKVKVNFSCAKNAWLPMPW